MPNPSPQDLKHITGWIKQLHDAVPSTANEPPTKEKWAVLASLLGNDYPVGAFTMGSLHLTAQGIGYFPAYEHIRARVGSWWQVNKPSIARAIDDPRYNGLNAMERSWLSTWDSAVARGFKPLRDGDEPTNPGVLGSLIKRHAPRVWDRLNPSEPPADHDAYAAWLKNDWANEERLFDLVEQCGSDGVMLTMLRILVGRHAPHLLYMVPDHSAAGSASQALANRWRGPKFLTPEQLGRA